MLAMDEYMNWFSILRVNFCIVEYVDKRFWVILSTSNLEITVEYIIIF